MQILTESSKKKNVLIYLFCRTLDTMCAVRIAFSELYYFMKLYVEGSRNGVLFSLAKVTFDETSVFHFINLFRDQKRVKMST